VRIRFIGAIAYYKKAFCRFILYEPTWSRNTQCSTSAWGRLNFDMHFLGQGDEVNTVEAGFED